MTWQSLDMINRKDQLETSGAGGADRENMRFWCKSYKDCGNATTR